MQTKIIDPTENCKQATLTEPKSAKPTGQSLDALLDCVVAKESDAVKLSIPTDRRHLNKYQIHARYHTLVPSLQTATTDSPLGKYAHT